MFEEIVAVKAACGDAHLKVILETGELETLDNGKTVPFCIGCSGDSPLEGKLAADLSSATRPVNRLYWYIKE